MNRKITEQKIKEVTRKIVKKFQPDKIILFGSWAWGEPTQDSDVDLFIIKKTKNSRQLAMDIDDFLFPRLFPMDIIVHTPRQTEKRKNIGDFFINDILNEGKILYAN